MGIDDLRKATEDDITAALARAEMALPIATGGEALDLFEAMLIRMGDDGDYELRGEDVAEALEGAWVSLPIATLTEALDLINVMLDHLIGPWEDLCEGSEPLWHWPIHASGE